MNQLMMNHKYHGYIVFEARVSLKIINFLGRQKSPQTHCFPDSENWMRGNAQEIRKIKSQLFDGSRSGFPADFP